MEVMSLGFGYNFNQTIQYHQIYISKCSTFFRTGAIVSLSGLMFLVPNKFFKFLFEGKRYLVYSYFLYTRRYISEWS